MFERTMEKIIPETSRDFPVILLTGMRQIGKSWLVENLARRGRRYVCLDDVKARETARKDPRRFIEENRPPVIIDEVQYAPELFPYIKLYVDEKKQNGLFWLTGSQKFSLMKGIRESLAGRVAILDMLGLSYREITGNPKGKAFLPKLELAGKTPFAQPLTAPELFAHIWNGSFPRILANPKINKKRFYASFVQTYIARDVRDFYLIEDELAFYNFLTAVAARTGELLNYTNLANDVHIDLRTAKLWLAILERSGVIQLLYPYNRNITKRIVKSPKVYFLDTGLACFLTNWTSPESLLTGAQNGHMLETWVFSEILKSYWHNGEIPNIFFYRDTNGKEIDFLIEQDMTLYPMEVKKTAMPGDADIKNFEELDRLGKKRGTGAILCLYPKCISLPKKNAISVPVWEI
ncbi:MAG: ATP-binding protein [Treponema sp.]|nr:ATP-binding protein [Treponema sp.]